METRIPTFPEVGVPVRACGIAGYSSGILRLGGLCDSCVTVSHVGNSPFDNRWQRDSRTARIKEIDHRKPSIDSSFYRFPRKRPSGKIIFISNFPLTPLS